MIEQEQRIINFIRGYIRSNGESPTMGEIAKYFQIKGVSSVVKILNRMEERGLIKRTPNISRGIEVL